jgi:hypothetical protein
VQGAPGTGNQGFQGVQGAPGTGNQGFQGVQGAPGAGNQGFQGVQGAQGFQGVAGVGAQGVGVSYSAIGVNTAAGSTGEIRATGDITAYFSSDRRLKENIRTIENALELIRQIEGVRYDWKDDHIKDRGGEDGYFVRKQDIGVIAQDVQEILPEVVAERPDGTLAVRYERIVALLLAAVKELDAKHDRLLNHLRGI